MHPFPLSPVLTSQLFTGYKPQSTALLQGLIIGNEPCQSFTPQWACDEAFPLISAS
jgi:hypothetical protein